MHRGFLKTATLLGALAVMLGAFGAHGLREILSPRDLVTFDTAVRYQFYHVFALLATAILYSAFNKRVIIWAGRLFILGMIIFCGSLYTMMGWRATGNEGLGWLGAVTPLGGICFVIGWLLLFWAVLSTRAGSGYNGG